MIEICQVPIIISNIKIPCYDKNIVDIYLNILKIF